MSILDFLNGYKKISAFFAAYKIGLFDVLSEKETSADTLANKLNIDETMCRLLLFKLREAQFVTKKKRLWFLDETFIEEYNGIDRFKAQIEHEFNIYNRLMRPDLIISSLKSGYGNRPFDKSGFTDEEQMVYDRAMYGENVKLIALQLYRLLRGDHGIKAVEIGRSKGAILEKLKELGLKFDSKSVSDEAVEDSEKYNTAIIFNTIHYWKESDLQKQIDQWKEKLTNEARVFIIDFFYEEGDEFVSNILIDWITHGGIYWTVFEELNDFMSVSGYKNTKDIQLKSIHTRMLQYQRDQETNV